MLSLSHPATGEYKWTDINELIDDTLSLVGFDRRAKSITIKNIANPDLPMVWLNPQNFEQVLLNIFINALDAMNAKQGEQKDILEITRESKDGMIEIRVSDTGIGMSPQVARRAFESFFTTKEIGKGTGLGLFISYNLVAEIDGTIAMESELDKGTTVIIQIPKRPKKHLIGTDDVKKDFLNSVKAVKEGDG
jgi:signal transduction histidine kinase